MDPNQELAKKLISNGHNLVLAGQGVQEKHIQFSHVTNN